MSANHAHGRTIEETAQVTRLATWLSVGAASLLIAVKGGIWLMSGSVALLASAADSALDLAASVATFFAVRYAAAPPDREHRYGHGKAEAFASLLQAGLVFASAALVGREAIASLFHPRPVENTSWAMAAMVVSIVVTGLLVTTQTRLLRQAGSVAVAGDRAHYASDLASNVAALVGIAAASLTGQLWIDAIAGLLVALWLVWGAIGVFRGATAELLDKELGQDERELIRTTAGADPRIRNIHQLRTRASGPRIHIQFHAALDPFIPLAMAHQIIEAAETRLLEAFPAADIIIHADPEGLDEVHAPFT